MFDITTKSIYKLKTIKSTKDKGLSDHCIAVKRICPREENFLPLSGSYLLRLLYDNVST